MKIAIRRANSNDTNGIIKLNSSEFEDKLDLTKGWWWVATLSDGETVVGFAGMQQSNNDKSGVYFCRAVVQSRFQGMGIHKKLIRTREKHARRLSYTKVYTDTSFENYGSMNALIACGYKTFSPVFNWATYYSPVYWTKDL